MSTAPSSSSPTTRSRTLLFISYRDSRTRSSRFSRPLSSYDDPYQASDEHEHLIASGARHVALDAQLPPKWYPCPVQRGISISHASRNCRVDLSDQVEEILANVQAKGAFLMQYSLSRIPTTMTKSAPSKSFTQSMFSPDSRTGLLKRRRSRQRLPI